MPMYSFAYFTTFSVIYGYRRMFSSSTAVRSPFPAGEGIEDRSTETGLSQMKTICDSPFSLFSFALTRQPLVFRFSVCRSIAAQDVARLHGTVQPHIELHARVRGRGDGGVRLVKQSRRGKRAPHTAG